MTLILLFGLDHNFVSLMFLLHVAIFSHSNPNFPYENTHTHLSGVGVIRVGSKIGTWAAY